jgi:hypothetical protein
VIPPELYVPGLEEPQQFYWHVIIMRQTGTAENGTRNGKAISPPTPTRSFTWK